MAVGDVTSDGVLDLVAVQAETLGVLEGNGDGSFRPVRIQSGLPFLPQDDAQLGDLDSDGRLDLVLSSTTLFGMPGQVAVLLGTGKGTFQFREQHSVPGSAPTLALGDFTSDGLLDVVVGNNVGFPNPTATLSLLIGNGDGSLQAPQNLTLGPGMIWYVAATDLDGDGLPDLAVTRQASLELFLGNGDGSFRTIGAWRVGSPARAVAAGDLDFDGDSDLVITSHSDAGVWVLLNQGDGTFPETNRLLGVADAPHTVVIADFNADGVPDLALSDSFGDSVVVLLGHGDGTFHTPAMYPVSPLPRATALADLNGDGWNDVVACDSFLRQVSVLLNQGDGTFTPHGTYATQGDPVSLVLGDLNRDGFLDLVTANEHDSSVSVLLGQGGGAFGPAAVYAARLGAIDLTLADFNKDGQLDVAVGNRSSLEFLSVLLGNGDGTLQPQQVVSGQASGGRLVSGDFNQDSLTDVVVIHDPLSSADLLLGRGDGSFHPPIPIRIPGPFDESPDVVAGDFDGDGAPDLAFVNVQSLSIHRGNGDGSFAQPIIYSVRSGSRLTSLDLDGDSVLDLAVTSYLLQNVALFRGLGDGRFSPVPGLIAAGPKPNHLSAGDVSADGIADLLTANRRDDAVFQGYLGVYLGHGDGTFQAGENYPVAADAGSREYNPQKIFANDHNGDGLADLVVPLVESAAVFLQRPGSGPGMQAGGDEDWVSIVAAALVERPDRGRTGPAPREAVPLSAGMLPTRVPNPSVRPDTEGTVSRVGVQCSLWQPPLAARPAQEACPNHPLGPPCIGVLEGNGDGCFPEDWGSMAAALTERPARDGASLAWHAPDPCSRPLRGARCRRNGFTCESPTSPVATALGSVARS